MNKPMAKTENHKLHIFFFPFHAYGHIIPTLDMAKLFASRGVRITIVTSSLFDLPLISKSIQSSTSLGHSINLITIQFPNVDDGIGISSSSQSDQLLSLLIKASTMLQQPLEKLLIQHQPHCVIADFVYPWAIDSAARFGIPGIVFHGIGSFAMCVSESLALYKPFKNVLSDSDPFVIPNLPGNEIKMTRMVLPHFLLMNDDEIENNNEVTRMIKAGAEAQQRSFGVVVNSFYELDGVYADHYKKDPKKKLWLIGPVSLCNRDDIQGKSNRGKQVSIIDEQEWLKWLDSKKPNSVVYVSFGSKSNFSNSQLKDIAMGLEASCQNFIWVISKRRKEDGDEDEEWLPEGFEKRIKEKGLILRGWAPQVLILDHEAVGGFVTHCGWNSTLEAISAGVPMVTWPMGSDQFYNEKFVTEVIRTGVLVGVKKYVSGFEDSIEKEAIVKAVKEIMEGEEAEEMRNRAKKLGKMAREAVEEGGSSYCELDSLIEELLMFSNQTKDCDDV